MVKKSSLRCTSLLACLIIPSFNSVAAPSQSDFGGVGLMQLPTARMSDEGELSFNVSYVDPYIRGSVAITPLPWFEGVIRYTSVENRLYSNDPDFSGDQTYKDKGFDAKFRLWQESYYMPDIALGFRDLGGTGLFSSEYLVASKAWGDIDFTLGMGWGYLSHGSSTRNPFCVIKDGACLREEWKKTDNDVGGKVSFGNFFRGENVGIFAGMEYQTPWEPLRLKIEYDSNDYQNEGLHNQFEQKSPINVGAVYSVGDYLKFHIGYERGTTLMAGLTLRTNFQSEPNQLKLDPPPVPLQAEPKPVETEELTLALSENAGLKTQNIQQQDNRLVLSGQQTKYRDRSVADERIARLLHNNTGPEIESFTVIEKSNGQSWYQTTIDRQDFLAQMTHQLDPNQDQYSYVHTEEVTAITESDMSELEQERYNLSFYPSLYQSFGSAETFYFYAVNLNATAEYQFTDSLKFDTAATWTIIDNFDKYNYTIDNSTGAIPRTRSLIREYLSESSIGISNLQLTWFDQYGKDIYAQYYAGYLEFMFGGAGGEWLYRPYNSSWAFGVDLNRVKQRDYDRLFGFQDYEVTTGHASLYWQLPWYDIHAHVSAGQYLSGDRGMTFDFSREFDNGTIAGFFFAQTNVSIEDYGEGSFNKGFYIKIPFDMMLTRSSTQYANLSWVPLTRDGGQKLIQKYSLYNLSDPKGRNSITSHK